MPIQIRKMTDEEYDVFYRWSVDSYAKELMEDGKRSLEEAVKTAQEEASRMLSSAREAEHHHLMSIEETTTQETVGFLWTLHEETNGKKQSFLCDFVILESKRRQGYGMAALSLMERLAAEAGCKESVLFVADKNFPARALYQKCGYQFLRQFEHGTYMAKALTK